MARSWLTLPVLLAAVGSGGCGSLDAGGESGGREGEGGFGTTGASSGTVGNDTSSVGILSEEPSIDGCGPGTPFEAAPLRATSSASATYSLLALRAGRLPEPAAIRADEVWNAFGPSAAREAHGAIVRASPRSLGDPLSVTLDVRYLPSAAELGPRPPVHLVVAADVGESMARELQLEADVLRALGGALDVEGDRLSVILWGAPEVVIFEVAEPGARAEAAATTIEALVGQQLVPSAGFERVVPWIEGVLGAEPAAHVLLLTDGGSPIEPADVAALALTAPVSIAQLAVIDAAPAAGEAAAPVPFVGTMLRDVATAGDGAALWIGADVSGADLTSFALSFDATFRRVSISSGLAVSPPAWLQVVAGTSDGAELTRLKPLGFGEPARIEAAATICQTLDLSAPIVGMLSSPLGTDVSFSGPPALPNEQFPLVDALVAHTLAVEEAAAIIAKPCHDPVLRASFNAHVELTGQRDMGRVEHLKEMVSDHASLTVACEVTP